MKLTRNGMFLLAALVAGFLVTVSPAAAEGAAGASTFKAKCLTCHGPDGSGNTAVGKSLGVADLRSPEIQKKSDAELTQSVSEGKGNMPAFKNMLSEDEIRAVLQYVRSLASKAGSDPKKKQQN